MKKNYQHHLDTAKELSLKGSYPEALTASRTALEAATSDMQVTEAATLTAELCKTVNEPQKALEAYQRALEASEKLQDDQDPVSLWRMANLHRLKGEVYDAMYDIDQAIDALTTAFKIYEKLPGDLFNEEISPLTATAVKLAELYKAKNKTFFWRKYAIAGLTSLDDREPTEQVLTARAHILGLIAESYEEEDYPMATLYWTRARDIYETLSDEDPIHLSYLAVAYNNIGVNQKRHREHAKSAQSYMKALEIFLELHDSEPLEYKPFLAGTYNSLGILFTEMFDKDEAYNYYSEAEKHYDELATLYPGMFQPYLATVRHNIGSYFDDMQKYDKALEYYRNALDLRRQLAGSGTDSFVVDMAVTGLNMMTVYQSLIEGKADFEVIPEATILLQSIRQGTSELNSDLPVVQSIMSDLEYYEEFLLELDMAAIAIKVALQRSLDLDEKVTQADGRSEREELISTNEALINGMIDQYGSTDELVERLAEIRSYRGWYDLIAGDMEKAEKWIRKGIDQNPDGFITRTNLAHWLWLSGEKDSAMEIYRDLLTNSGKMNGPIRDAIKTDMFRLDIAGYDVSKLKKDLSGIHTPTLSRLA